MLVPRRRWMRATAVLVAAVVAGGIGAGVETAHAKSLGGVTSKSLMGKSWPTDAITDNFNDTLGTSLATTTDTNNDAWIVSSGSFTIAATASPVSVGVRASTTAASEATVPGTVNASVGGDLHIVGTTSSFGLILNAAGASSYAATLLLYDRGARTLTLYRVSPAGVRTMLGSAYTVTLANNYLRLTYSNGVYNAYVDNTTSRITYTEAGALRTEVESYSRVGFGTTGDNTSIFDNFQEYPL